MYKAIKQVTQVHTISSEERTLALMSVATHISDNDIIYKLTHENFTNKALDHRSCITKYVLKK